MQGRIKNIFLEKTVWIGIVAAASAIVAGSITGVGDMQVWQEQSVWKLLGEGLRSRILCFVIPVTAAVSGSDLYLRERQSGFLKFYVAREDKTRYQKEKNRSDFLQRGGNLDCGRLSGDDRILAVRKRENSAYRMERKPKRDEICGEPAAESSSHLRGGGSSWGSLRDCDKEPLSDDGNSIHRLLFFDPASGAVF